MAEATVVQGLTGFEIIEDLLNKLRTALRRDCNLRDSDSYTGGYSAQFGGELQLYGVDVTPVKFDIHVGSENPEEKNVVKVEVSVDIPQEMELNEVRERSGLEEPILSANPEGVPEIRRRKYSRRVVTGAAPESGDGESVIQGGAQEFSE